MLAIRGMPVHAQAGQCHLAACAIEVSRSPRRGPLQQWGLRARLRDFGHEQERFSVKHRTNCTLEVALYEKAATHLGYFSLIRETVVNDIASY
jgi:hypothetical protein